MELIEFYKKYYKTTMSEFPRVSSLSRYNHITPKSRKFDIIVCYILLMLLIILIPIVVIYEPVFLIFIFLGLVFDIVSINDCRFNVIKIYRFYKICNKNDVYSSWLKHEFYTSSGYEIVRKNLNVKDINMRTSLFRLKFITTYKNNKLVLVVKSNKLILKYNDYKIIYNKTYDKLNDLFDEIKYDLNGLE